MKKILTIIIAALMLAMQLPVYAQSDTEDISEEKIKLLEDLGIISSYNADANVSLSEFTAAIGAITGSQDRARQYFSDSRLADNKLIKYSELLPVLIDLCGYTPYFNLKYNGITETSCTRLAAEAGITSGINIKFNGNVTGREFAEMLYNTLFAEVLQCEKNGNNTSYKTISGENVLYVESGLYEVKGIVKGAGLTVLGGLWETDDASYKMVNIDGQNYWCIPDYISDDIAGRNVKAYVSRDDDEIHAITIPENFNNEITVETEDILKPPSEKDLYFTYYDESGRARSARLQYSADVVYNGRLLGNFDSTVFQVKEGKVTFIDNDRDNRYDVVLINKYDSFVVQTVGTDCETIIDTDGNRYDFEKYFRDGNNIYNASGEKIDKSSVSSLNVLSVRYDKDGKATWMILNSQTVKGTVKSTRDNMKYIVVDDTEYQIDENYSASSNEIKSITSGNEITGYLDFRGKIVRLEIYKSVWQYAWAFSGYNGNGYESANMRLLDQNGAYGYVYLKDKVTLNGTKCTSEQCMDNAVFKDTDGTFKKQLVKIKLNSDGEITAIDTAKTNHGLGVCSDGTEFELNFDSEQGYSNDGTSNGTIVKTFRVVSTDGKKWFGAKYVADSSAPLFLINADRPERSIVRLAGNIETGNSVKVNLYDVDKDYVPGAIVRFMTDNTATAYIDPYKNSYLVKNVCEAINDDNEEVIRVYCYYYYEKELQYFDFEDTELHTYSYNNLTGDPRLTGVKLRDIKPGSIISVNTDPDTNRGIAYALRFMPMEDDSEVVYEAGETDGSWDYGITTGVWNANGLFAYGPVYGKTKYGVVTNYHDETAHMWDRHVIFNSSTGVYIFNKSNNKVELGSWLDIDIGDMLFVHKLKGSYINVVVYK